MRNQSSSRQTSIEKHRPEKPEISRFARSVDRLTTARGVLLGLAISLVFWMLVAFALSKLLK